MNANSIARAWLLAAALIFVGVLVRDIGGNWYVALALFALASFPLLAGVFVFFLCFISWTWD